LGLFWRSQSLLEFDALQLTQPLQLQGTPENLGVFPKGNIMYPYSSGDTDTYIFFVNTKNRNVLFSVKFEHFMTVAFIDAYID
jgi:hypothetical protein